MAIKLQLRRGTAEQNDAFTGALGEPSFNTTSNSIRIHDGSTQGGHVILGESNISNCLVRIPQYIKLTLSNGTFTLASGSVLYTADGTASTTTTDRTLTPSLGTFTGKSLIFATSAGAMQNPVDVSKITSGTTEPANPNNLDVFFNTSTKVVRLYNNGNWIDWPVCCPIAEISVSSGTITSFQVFNGFGYMGSTLFMLPGISGLRPNGRNDDASLKNIKLTVNNIRFTTSVSTYTNAAIVVATTGNAVGNYTYDETNNYVLASNGNIQPDRFIAGWLSITGGKITSLVPKTLFQAVDYNDFLNLSGLTQNADFVIASQIPTAANNYTWYRLYKSGWVEQGGRNDGSNATGSNTFSIEMADTSYNVLITRLYPTTADDPAAITIQARSLSTTSFIGRQTYATASTGGTGSGNSYAYCWQVSGIAA